MPIGMTCYFALCAIFTVDGYNVRVRRLGRWILRSLSVLSLLLLIASIVLWIRSDSHQDTLQLHQEAEAVTDQNTAPIGAAEVDRWRARWKWSQIFKAHLWTVGVEKTNLFWGASTDLQPDNQLGWRYADVGFLPPHVELDTLRRMNFNPPPFTDKYRWGIETIQIHAGFTSERYTLVPIWVLAVIAAIVPSYYAVILARWRIAKILARVKRRQNLCAKCGYDLRATPERCPECGTIPSKT